MMKLALYSDLHVTRFTLGLAELIWGVSLLMPGRTLDRPVYVAMGHLCSSEEAWGFLWLASSVVQFYIVGTGKYHTPWSVAFACFNSVLWWVVTLSMYLSIFPVPSYVSGDTALSVAATLVWVRSGWVAKGRRKNHADA